jgi:hypothetical protein
MNLNINELKPGLIEFHGYEIADCSVMWQNTARLASLGLSEDCGSDYFRPYFVFGNDFIKSERYNLAKRISFTGERYGGIGIGTNGGGARCGNYNGFQYKGIGCNFLASNATKKSHANGTLTLLDGITEVIYSEVLSQLLPMGVVPSIALLSVGNDSAYCEYSGTGSRKTTSGAILIRETCIRPAHFFPIPHYQPNEQDVDFNDSARLKDIHKIFANQFTGYENFANYIGELLGRHASQFAFARIARIAHGAVSPSNIALDGRWLDLNTVNFLPGGFNHATSDRQIPFYQEAQSVNDIFQELIHTFCKYNKLNLSKEKLSEFYKKQLNIAFQYHTPWLLGIDRKLVGNNSPTIAIEIMKELSLEPSIVLRQPKETDNKNLKSFISSAFNYAITNAKFSLEENNLTDKTVGGKLLKTIKNVHKASPEEHCSLLSFTIKTYLTACKRAYFHDFFKRSRITEIIIPMINKNENQSIKELIEQITFASTWIFDDNHSTVVNIFNSTKLEIKYDSVQRNYCLNNLASEDTVKFNTPCRLIDFIEKLDSDSLVMAHFDFKPSIIEILSGIPNES